VSRAAGCVSMVSPLRVRCSEADTRATRRRLLGCPEEPQPSHPRGGARGRAGIVPRRRRPVIDVREAIEEIQVRTGDQAYWHALEMGLGTLTARTLRSTLRLKIRGEDLSERERVAKGLAEIFSAQAATVDNLARREAALRGPRPREAALQELETHSHWVDFSDPANEARRAMGCVKRGIERGAKVVALLPSPDLEAYRRQPVEPECGEDLDSGRVSLESVDDRLEMLKTAGVLAVLLLSIQGLIQVARGQGYPEVWLVGKIASSLFASAPQYPALTLRLAAT